MKGQNTQATTRFDEFGAAIYLVAGVMVVLLGVSALAIDLVSLYVTRGEAQRAADAAALAGGDMFITQGCTSGTNGCVAGGPQEALANQQALAVAAQNLVGGQAPSRSSISTSFSYPSAMEPQMTVTVYRDSAHGNAMPTFFAKMFGISAVDVSASATAEAFNPATSTVAVGESCLRPFLVPNCDQTHPVRASDPEANTDCQGNGTAGSGYTIQCTDNTSGCYPSYFMDPNNNGAIVHPGTYLPSNPSTGGIVGMPWQLHSEAGPSQYYDIAFTGQSGNLFDQWIYTCSPYVVSCATPLNSLNGKKVGDAEHGVWTLIHANGDGLNQGQDSICSPTTTPACTTPPFTITGGANNPNASLVGKTYYGPSDSSASVAVYDGHQLPSGGGSAIVVGYFQLFVQDIIHNGSDDELDTIILNSAGCGTKIPNPAPLTSQGGTPIPVRLIRKSFHTD